MINYACPLVSQYNNDEQKQWLEDFASGLFRYSDNNTDLRLLAMTIPVSRLNSLVILYCKADLSLREKDIIYALIKYRFTPRIARFVWELFQYHVDCGPLINLCSELTIAWQGRSYSEFDNITDKLNLPDKNSLTDWLHRLALPAEQKEIPLWASFIPEVLNDPALDKEKGNFEFGFCSKFYNYFLNNYDYSEFSKFEADFNLISGSGIEFLLLYYICVRKEDTDFLKNNSEIIEEYVLQRSNQSVKIFESYLKLLEPHQYDDRIFQKIRKEREIYDRIPWIMIDEIAQRNFELWQNLADIKDWFSDNKRKLSLIERYIPLIKRIKILEKNQGSMLLIYFDRIILGDNKEDYKNILIYPVEMLSKSIDSIDIYEHIEGRQAVLQAAEDGFYSSQIINSVKSGKGSQAININVEGASVLYAKQIMDELLS